MARIKDALIDPIQRKAADDWIGENMFPRNGWHEPIGIGFHNQHVIDFNMRYSTKGQLLDLSHYCQVYSIPLRSERKLWPE